MDNIGTQLIVNGRKHREILIMNNNLWCTTSDLRVCMGSDVCVCVCVSVYECVCK